MSYYGDNLQRPNLGSAYLRDFTHAAKIFRPGSYDVAPKFKFLFHTFFDINPVAYSRNANTGDNFGVLVKTVRLPSFSMKTQELNQYNRKRIVQTKINYEPINITFHDDNINMVTKLWDAYYTYYYKDATNFNGLINGSRTNNTENAQINNNSNWNARNIYDGDLTGENNWGYIGENFGAGGITKAPFFRNITIFGFNRHNFTAYTLINPMITKLDHDTYSYAEASGTMEIKMDINYETVVYNEGTMDGRNPDNIVSSFGLDAFYDKTLSTITPPGANSAEAAKAGYKDANGGSVRSMSLSGGTLAQRKLGTISNHRSTGLSGESSGYGRLTWI